jgi:hypothetical protein
MKINIANACLLAKGWGGCTDFIEITEKKYGGTHYYIFNPSTFKVSIKNKNRTNVLL